MKVLYDYQGFTQRIGGVSRYSLELMNNLSPDIIPILPKIWSDNVYLSECHVTHNSFMGANSKSWKYDCYKALNIAQSLYHLHKDDYDVFHPLFYNPYFCNHTNKPVVVTVYDLNFDKFPSMLPNANAVSKRMKKSCSRAQKIIAISDETKIDLIKYHNVPEEKIVTIYLGMNQDLIKVEKDRIQRDPYILYIGARNGYKNFHNFLRGFSLLKGDVNLVCTGMPFNEQEKTLINKLGITKRVFQKFVTDDELYNLLYYAEAFVYPSLGEGFGVPILEAFRCSCPCFVSDIMCFHEVAGDAAYFFNPNEPDSIAKSLDKGMSDSVGLTALKNKGIEQLRKFTWAEMAKKTENVYRNLLNE
jgi:glycosyltransferase involved in cell wall biosynthesis